MCRPGTGMFEKFMFLFPIASQAISDIVPPMNHLRAVFCKMRCACIVSV